MIVNRARAYVLGEFPPRVLRIHLLLAAAVFGGLVYAAFAAFPGYSMTVHTISALGNPEANPAGWWLFSLAVWAQAAVNLPFFMFARRVIAPRAPRAATLVAATTLVISAGLVVLGFFPENPPNVPGHIVGASLAFGGFFAMAPLTWHGTLVAARDAPAGRRKFLTVVTVINTVAFFGICIAAITGIALDTSTLPFWEWMYMFGIGAYMLLLEIAISRVPPGARSE